STAWQTTVQTPVASTAPPRWGRREAPKPSKPPGCGSSEVRYGRCRNRRTRMSNGANEDAIRAATSDYIEGWFDGDAARMERALHPELAKRCRGIEGDDPDALETLSATEMIDATADGEGRREDAPDRQIEMKIEYLSGDIASVTCLCH